MTELTEIAFGGGTVLCPGRYFATNSILGIVASIITGYDIATPGPERKTISVPPFRKQTLGAQVKHPRDAMPVEMRRRRGWEGIKFVYDFGGEGEGREGREGLEF